MDCFVCTAQRSSAFLAATESRELPPSQGADLSPATDYEGQNPRGAATPPGRGQVRVHSDGSLVVTRALEHHEGRYLCQATNGVGPGLSRIVTLRVQGKDYPG